MKNTLDHSKVFFHPHLANGVDVCYNGKNEFSMTSKGAS